MIYRLFQTPAAVEIIEQADENNIIKCRHVMGMFSERIISASTEDDSKEFSSYRQSFLIRICCYISLLLGFQEMSTQFHQ